MSAAALLPSRCGRSVRIAGICRSGARRRSRSAGERARTPSRSTEQNFQELLETSRSAPVLLAFESPSRSPESVQLADDLQTLSTEFEGRFLLGRVDIDAVPQIAQAMQIPSVPLVVLVAQGRPMPLLQDAAPARGAAPGDHPGAAAADRAAASPAGTSRAPAHGEVDEETGEEQLDPRYAPAQDALERGDIDAAVAEYQKLVDANPADSEAAAGLAMAKLLKRTEGVDLSQARAAAAESPDDVDAQTLVADLDLLGGHVEDAFNRLVDAGASYDGGRPGHRPDPPDRPVRRRRQRGPARAARPSRPRLRAVLTGPDVLTAGAPALCGNRYRRSKRRPRRPRNIAA